MRRRKRLIYAVGVVLAVVGAGMLTLGNNRDKKTNELKLNIQPVYENGNSLTIETTREAKVQVSIDDKIIQRFTAKKAITRVKIVAPVGSTINVLAKNSGQQLTKMTTVERSNWMGKKVAIFGDSLAWGQVNYGPQYSKVKRLKTPYITSALKQLGVAKVDNFAVPGGGISISKPSKNVKTQIVNHTYPTADLIIIAIGTNDYRHQEKANNGNLALVKQQLIKDIQIVKSKNATAELIAVLPPLTFAQNRDSLYESEGVNGFTLKQLDDMLTEVYRSMGIRYLDWREPQYTVITKAEQLSDYRTHPSEKIYFQMTNKLIEFLQ